MLLMMRLREFEAFGALPKLLRRSHESPWQVRFKTRKVNSVYSIRPY